MTIIDEVRETFKGTEIFTEFTTAEIKQLVFDKFGRNQASVIPSDYSYNMINKGIINTPFQNFNIFIQVKHGVYQYVGEDYHFKEDSLSRFNKNKETMQLTEIKK